MSVKFNEGTPNRNASIAFFLATPAVAWAWVVGKLCGVNTELFLSNGVTVREAIVDTETRNTMLGDLVMTAAVDIEAHGLAPVEQEDGTVVEGYGLIAPKGADFIKRVGLNIYAERKEAGAPVPPHVDRFYTAILDSHNKKES
jgi:hypothetical protein